MNRSDVTPVRVATPDHLVHAEVLQSLLGPIASLTVQPMQTSGYSGAVFERVEVRLAHAGTQVMVCKRTRLAKDWVAYRSNDRLGREVALLAEARLRGVWDVMNCPYLAYAAAAGELGVLMTDLGPWLLPDVDEPLDPDDEHRLLTALTCLHARYWEADELALGWLNRPADLLGLLGPQAPARITGRAVEPLFEQVRAGWSAAMSRLPPRTAAWLARPPAELVQIVCDDLPRTLLHGDVKVGNFAVAPGGVAAFDWALIGAGPCTLDLGWYLAVNAGRLAHSKEEIAKRYRMLLERALGRGLDDELWDRLWAVAVLNGTCMLLWQKALAVADGSTWAAREWAWWLAALERWVIPELERRTPRPMAPTDTMHRMG